MCYHSLQLKCALSNPRARRHALPAFMNYEDNLGNGHNSRTYGDPIDRYSGGRNYNGREHNREEQQRNSAPHSRAVSDT